ncbi:MAG: DUF1566 domain-containing protein [Candidatus Magnetobacterium sp. LHC-1]|nr:DUF1566 domain-containing protein [Nitrospirota bacterium]
MNTKDTTNRFSYLLFVVLAAAWLIQPCLTGAAHAGTINLPQTGQSTTYATGDDGALQKGVAWPNPRFTDNHDQTMTDILTGLVWAKDAGTPTVDTCTGGSMQWQAALDYVACLNAANYLGYSDWRLPNINELESVTNMGEADSAAWLNSQGVANVQSAYYWSSTSNAVNVSEAWRVGMDNGLVYAYNKSDVNYVWPVRSGQSGAFDNAAVWSTGQSTSYATGDDGKLQNGVPWPNPRFTDNGNQTVTDNLTGLIWATDAATPTVNNCTGGGLQWQAALDYVACINAANYLGYNNWRLPNRKELLSLIDRERHNPPLQTGHPFANVQSYEYWSSTSHAYKESHAWAASMDGGYIYAFGKSYGYHVWPVRSGQTGESGTLVISISGTGGGTVTASTGTITWSGKTGTATYAPNTTVTLTAQPDMTSILGEWSGCDDVSSNQCTVSMTGNRTVTVTFNTIEGYLLTVTKTGFGDGMITTSEGTLTWNGNIGSALYKPDTEVVITANPDESSRFVGWTGCNLPLCIVKMTAKKDITAKFGRCNKARRDFDGDGKSDVLWKNFNTGDVAMWLMDGVTRKSNALAASAVPGNWVIRAAEDFNSDGRSDIMWQNTDTGGIYVWLMENTTIRDKGFVGKIPMDWQIKATGDFNNDCNNDILWQNSDSGDVVMWLMEGTTINDQAIIQKALPSQWQFAGIGDLNGDGSSDVVWQNTANGDIYGWLMDGLEIAQRNFIARGIPPEWKIKSIADYNGDGKGDIYLHNALTGQDVIFLMNGLKPVPELVKRSSVAGQLESLTPESASGADSWDMKATGDYNGDGMNDMLWQNGSTGDVYMWFMNSTTINSGGYAGQGVPSDWSIY